MDFGGSVLNSFKVKLAAYFALLALVPLAAVFWGFSTVAGTSETRRVDARLQGGLRAALALYQERVDAAQALADRLARRRALQVALERRDRAAVRSLLAGAPDVVVSGPNGFRVGDVPAPAARRSVDVVTSKGRAGTVTAAVPLDARLVAALRPHTGLAAADVLALLDGRRIEAASPPLAGSLDVAPGRTRTARVGGDRYRILLAPATGGVPNVRFAVLSPQAKIDAADAATRRRLLLGLLAALALVAVVAWLEGRSIVRTLRGLAAAAHGIARGSLAERVPVRGRDEFAQLGGAFNEMAAQLEARHAELERERARLAGAVARFGEALAATHEPDQLLRVVAESALETTGAAGVRLVLDGGESVERGDPGGGADRLELPLAAGDRVLGRLELAGDGFAEEQRSAAASLASHAAVALENARLHRLVERQALVDGLTGVANRRQCEDALHAEVARAERLRTPLALLVADLDDFKRVNDVHGHAAGDDVLRTFASVLRETLRDSDLAGRWGGEEFLALLPGADEDGAVHLAERLRESLAARHVDTPAGPLRVTCSVGVAGYRPGLGADALFAAADRALYRAKRAGKDRVERESLIRSF